MSISVKMSHKIVQLLECLLGSFSAHTMPVQMSEYYLAVNHNIDVPNKGHCTGLHMPFFHPLFISECGKTSGGWATLSSTECFRHIEFANAPGTKLRTTSWYHMFALLCFRIFLSDQILMVTFQKFKITIQNGSSIFICNYDVLPKTK